MEQPSVAKYRIDSRIIFYTWPQCTTKKEDVLAALVKGFEKKTIEFIIVCEELHESGEPHLHAITCCDKNRNATIPSWADKYAGKHGDYKAVRNIKQSVEYVMKKGNYVVYPEGYDFEARWKNSTETGRKRKVSDLIFGAIRDEGRSVRQLLLTEAAVGWIGLHFKRLEEFESAVKAARSAESAAASKEAWHLLEKKPSTSGSEERIIDWLNGNLVNGTRSLGTLQLYIHGPTGCGKTHLMSQLRRFFRVYDVPMDEDWYDDYNDEDYDLIVLEEFRGQKAITWMNGFIDGQVKPVRRKGVSAYLKKKNLPVIILSNYSLSGAYKNSNEEKLAPLSRRLEQIDLTFDHSSKNPIDIL